MLPPAPDELKTSVTLGGGADELPLNLKRGSGLTPRVGTDEPIAVQRAEMRVEKVNVSRSPARVR